MSIFKDNTIKKHIKEIKKARLYYRISIVWLDMAQHMLSIGQYLLKSGYKRIGIYGMKELGERLYSDLRMAGITPVCFIDQSDDIYGEIPIYKASDELPQMDLIIVTSVYYYDEIKIDLRKNIRDNSTIIIGIHELIGRIYGRNFD